MTDSTQGPYTAEGGYNIRKPNGDLLTFRGGFERDEILKLLNDSIAKVV